MSISKGNGILLGALLLLTGCSSYYKDSSVDLQTFAQKDKAIVIARAEYEFDKKFFGFDNGRGHSPIKNVWTRLTADGKSLTNHQYNFSRYRFMNAGSHVMDIYMVDPGTYGLEKMSYASGNLYYFLTLPKVPLRAKLGYGAFTVKAGDVVYIGDLILTRDRHGYDYRMADNFPAAQTLMGKEYPELAPRLTKRMVKFLPKVDANKFIDILNKKSS